MTTTYTPPGERVVAGAEWLDEHHPGWAKDIRLNDLRMAHPEYCVLGQIARAVVDHSRANFFSLVVNNGNPNYEGFMVPECVAALGLATQLTDEEAVSLGFDVDEPPHDEDDDESYSVLERLWSRQIRDRQ